MLTDTKLRNIRSGEKPLSVGGVPGLYFRAGAANGTEKFILRFVSPASKKRRDMGLGTYPTVGIAHARKKAMAARELISNGIDPIKNQRSQASIAQ